MHYLVDVAKTEYPEGKHSCPAGTYLPLPTIRAKWVATYNNEAEAIALAEKLMEDPKAVMVMVAAWENDEGKRITTGNYGTRHCALGARVVSVPFARERAVSQKRWSGQGCKIYHEVKFGSWADAEIAHLNNYSVGGGNWIGFTPNPVETAE
jgi:hypothetical protein